ncbi:hypothetical protein R3P38DRAFT_1374539 [Favolaschia claudopus]|uniref:Uncharacterized protein n=1 Tax=Favolaschia claudopus TaxID=2862362 RepID=A0AAW0DY44_9AGAR
MPSRTKSPSASTTHTIQQNREPEQSSKDTSPKRRSTRFGAVATPRASSSSSSSTTPPTPATPLSVTSTPTFRRILRPPSARKLSAKAKEASSSSSVSSPLVPHRERKRKSPEVVDAPEDGGGRGQDGAMVKRQRVRCPAEVCRLSCLLLSSSLVLFLCWVRISGVLGSFSGSFYVFVVLLAGIAFSGCLGGGASSRMSWILSIGA